jgi:putative transposase
MPQSYAGVFYHLVYRTKYKRMQIPRDLMLELYAYTGGIVRSDKGILIAAGGMPDHVHFLLTIHREISISDAVRNIKARSSKWLHERGHNDFQWQNGFSIFSVSASVVPKVKMYIANQEEHHKKMTFVQELIALYDQYGILYDKKYLTEEDTD